MRSILRLDAALGVAKKCRHDRQQIARALQKMSRTCHATSARS